jgi:hypothetical protein
MCSPFSFRTEKQSNLYPPASNLRKTWNMHLPYLYIYYINKVNYIYISYVYIYHAQEKTCLVHIYSTLGWFMTYHNHFIGA